MTGYYRDHVPDYATIALPLTEATKKGKPDKIVWGEAEEKSYETLKRLLSSPPILRLPDFQREFVLRCDASGVGLGAILLQQYDEGYHPVAYASRQLLPRETRYSTIERECLGIVWAVRKFEMYLFGRQFVIQTDHKPLTYMQTAKTVNDRVMRWAMYLQQFRYRIHSIPGKSNVGPDFLSRVPGSDTQ